MKSRKKIIIGFSIVAAVLLIAVVSLTAVLAAFSTTTTGGFNITYSAINVKAQVLAWARNGESEGFNAVNGLGQIDFDGTEQTSNNGHIKSFGTVNGIQFKYKVANDGKTRVRDPYYIKYRIFNKDQAFANKIQFSGKVDKVPTNLVIEYVTSYNSDLDFTTINKVDYDSNWTKLTTGNLNIVDKSDNAGKISGDGTNSMFVYIRMYPENLNLSVENTLVNFDFNLSVVD